MHYTPPDGASNEGMQIEWTAPSQPQEQLKVHATVTSLKKESVEGDIPASTIAPVFTQARLMTGSIRLKAAEEKPPVSNEHFSVDISHSLHEVSLEFTVRRTDATAWRAAVVFWNYLRGIMPASVREFVAERH